MPAIDSADPSTAAVFAHQGEEFLPLAAARGPWNPAHLHGGPPTGLMAHALEHSVDDSAFRLARLTVDLHSPVPAEALWVHLDTVKRSRRLWLRQATLRTAGGEVARASALYLHTSDAPTRLSERSVPPGPDRFETGPLFQKALLERMPPGFHTAVETRWVPRDRHRTRAIWFRLPLPLVAGEPTTPLTSACALADFAAAAATIDAAERGLLGVPYINTDTTLYLARPPVGEWFCVAARAQSEHDGINVIEVEHFDHAGAFGTSLQARIAQTRYRPVP